MSVNAVGVSENYGCQCCGRQSVLWVLVGAVGASPGWCQSVNAVGVCQ